MSRRKGKVFKGGKRIGKESYQQKMHCFRKVGLPKEIKRGLSRGLSHYAYQAIPCCLAKGYSWEVETTIRLGIKSFFGSVEFCTNDSILGPLSHF